MKAPALTLITPFAGTERPWLARWLDTQAQADWATMRQNLVDAVNALPA